MKSFRELSSLAGRVAAVTGGAGHLGRVFSDVLAELGAEVCVLDVAADKARECSAHVNSKYGIKSTPVAIDITSETQVQEAIDKIIAEHGRIDILINNAAYSPTKYAPDGLALTEQGSKQWEAQLAVILNGTFLVTRAAASYLGAHGCGTVINIASIYGLVGPDPALYEGTSMANPAYYAAGKGGIIQLTRYLATMLAPATRVNCVAPGGIFRNQPESFRARYEARTPLRRMATEEDLKGVVGFLASDLSAYVTGQILPVDGGWTAW